MKIRDYEIPVDVREELDRYAWRNGREKGAEFVCCSPFRDENHPSFSINLDTGLWIDFGSTDDAWKKGSLPRLISWLENISVEDAENMLLEAYGMIQDDIEDLDLTINLEEVEEEKRTFSREELRPYLIRTDASIRYIWGRGVSDQIMRKFVVGYNESKKAVAFFWQDAFTGKVVNVKFRTIAGKQFYYMNGGQQIKDHLFGLYHVIQEGHKRIWIVESEIDCLYLWSHGIPAVAIGGSYLSVSQKSLLRRSGIEAITIATDNDAAGDRLRESIKRDLGGEFDLKDLKFPAAAKDVNDLTAAEIAAAEIQDVTFSFLS